MSSTNLVQCTLLANPEPELVNLDKATANLYIKQFHYLKEKGSVASIIHGLVIDGKVVGVAEWKPPSAPETVVGAFGLERDNQERIFELGRFVLSSNVHNRASFFLGRSIKLLKRQVKVRALITYADSRFHVGKIYQATNWKYYGLTDKKKDFLVNGKIQERGKTKGIKGEWKDRPRKHRYALVFDKSLTIKWKLSVYPSLHAQEIKEDKKCK